MSGIDTLTLQKIYKEWLKLEGTNFELCTIAKAGGRARRRGCHPKKWEEVRKMVLDCEKAGEPLYTTFNRVKAGVSGTTKDEDIEERRYIVVDIDPEKPTECMATEAEVEEAHKVALAVYDDLEARGMKGIDVVMSGNGFHLKVPVKLGNTEESEQRVIRFLKELAERYDTEGAKVDRCVKNAARLIRLAWTMNCKGEDSAERPWRRSELLIDGGMWDESVARANSELLKVVDLEEPETLTMTESVETRNVTEPEGLRRSREWVARLLRGKEIDYREERHGEGVKLLLERCPWEKEHTVESVPYHDAAVLIEGSGRIGFKCQHGHCSGRDWQTLKEWLLTPTQKAYEWGKSSEHFTTVSDFYTKMGRDDYEGLVPTGYNTIDEVIKGLLPGQMTVLAGDTSAGKTTFAVSLSMNLIESGKRVAYYSNEMTTNQIAGRLMLAAARGGETQKGDLGWFVKGEKKKEVMERLQNLVIHQGSTEGDEIVRSIYELGGVDVVVVDNLMSVGLSNASMDASPNAAQKQFVRSLTVVAKAMGIHIVLIAHCKKTNDKLARKGDIFGSSDILNLVDNGLMIHRGDSEANHDFSKKMRDYYKDSLPIPLTFDVYCEVIKNRNFGVERWCGLMYEESRGRVVER